MLRESPIYLDYNATCPILPEVKTGMIKLMDLPLNPSSVHRYGKEAKMIIENARKKIATLIKADERFQVIFTSSGTEANNIALKGFKNLRVLTAAVEHPSVLEIAKEAVIPVDENGVIKLDVLEYLLQKEGPSVLVSIQAANNETGVMQPMAEIAKLVHAYGGLFHTDAVQVCGKIEFDISALDIDLATISGHKFGGPIGASALVFKKSLSLKPLMYGGGQEYRFRPGTQNTIAIHGFGLAADIAGGQSHNMKKVEEIRNYLEDKIQKNYPAAVIFGKNARRLPNTSLIAMKGVTSETQLIYFDLNKIAVSAGAACSSGKVEFSRVLMAMNVEPEIAKNALRISIGCNSTKEEIDIFADLWLDFAKKQQTKLAVRNLM